MRAVIIKVVLLLALLISARAIASGADGLLWRELPPLPQPSGGQMAGISNGALLVIGGSWFPAPPWEGGTKQWLDTILVLEPGRDDWRIAGRLPHPLAYGGAVSDGKSLILIGGSDGVRNYATVTSLQYIAGNLQLTELPSLPLPSANFGVAIYGKTIYVAGGQSDPDSTSARQTLWSLELSEGATSCHSCQKWRVLEPLPATGRILPVAGVLDGSFFLFSGAELTADPAGRPARRYLSDSWRYHPRTGWARLADSPRPLVAAPAISIGQSHLLVFGGDDGSLANQVTTLRNSHPGFTPDTLFYNSITDAWTKLGVMPLPLVTTAVVRWNDEIVITGGEDRPAHRSGRVLAGRLNKTINPGAGGFGWVDYTVLGAYLLATLLVGLLFSRRSPTADDFFLGDRQIPAWAAGLSIYGTQLSAVTYLAVPAKTYAEDWTFLISTICIVLVAPVVIRFYLPFFRQLKVTTAYEYLEYRFNLAVRLFGSASFIALQTGRMAIVLFLPALALSTVGGLNIYVSIVLMGLLTTVYTMKGGIRAVIWTDVAQVFVLLGGAIVALVMLIKGSGEGVDGVVLTGLEAGKFHLFDLTWDMAAPTLWVMLAGNLATHLIPYTTDQSVVQKYLTTRSENDAARGIRLNALLTIPTGILFFATGTALFVFYKRHPELLSPGVQTDVTFAWFIANQLPRGTAGLVLAGVFAAAMSTLSSSLNSVATAVVTDFYSRLWPQVSDQSRIRLARWLTLALGVVGTGMAALMASFEIRSLWELFLRTIGLFGSGLAGIFLLGIFTRRTNAKGVLVGALTSTLVLFILPIWTSLHFFLHTAIAILTCVVIGYVVSVLLPSAQPSLKNLTIHD